MKFTNVKILFCFVFCLLLCCNHAHAAKKDPPKLNTSGLEFKVSDAKSVSSTQSPVSYDEQDSPKFNQLRFEGLNKYSLTGQTEGWQKASTFFYEFFEYGNPPRTKYEIPGNIYHIGEKSLIDSAE